MFVQQSQGYIQQIEEEIERLQQLLDQVRSTIKSEEQLTVVKPKRNAPRKQAGKKSAAKKASVAVGLKRGRPKKSAEPAAA